MALARRQALLAQMSAPPASPKRKRESAVSGGEEMDLPEALEALLAVFGQIEAISERFTSRGAVPTVDAVAEGAQLKRDVVLQVAAAVPELYRVERRASDAQLVLLRLPPAVASIDHSLPAWRQQEACLLSRRLAFRAALRAHWQSTGTAQLPAFTVPALPAAPRPAPAAATLPAKAAAKTQTKPAKAPARPAPALVAPADSTAVPDELKGLSLELIGRVRGREAERAQRRPLAASHEEEVVAALPRLADALRSLFAVTGAAKVASLPTSQLLLQLQTALAPQSKDAICEQVIALARIIPAWATLVSVAQESGDPVEYLRLDRTMPFPEVKRRLAESLQTVQNATNSEGERMKTKGT